MPFFRALLFGVIVASSHAVAEVSAQLPISNSAPSSNINSYVIAQNVLKPALPEMCSLNGILPPPSAPNCVNQCVCDQNANICQWIQLCR